MTIAERLFFALKLFSALGCGLIAGVFFAFSVFVMRGLAQLPPRESIAAMQSINIKIPNPLFLGVFTGTAAGCLVLAVSGLLKWHQPGAAFLLAGGLLYLFGAFLVTVVFNVPLNDALATVKPGSPDDARLWTAYLTTWTAWNHVRTIAALVAAASLTLAFYYGKPQ
jgi:uncharacterized membrane protein